MLEITFIIHGSAVTARQAKRSVVGGAAYPWAAIPHHGPREAGGGEKRLRVQGQKGKMGEGEGEGKGAREKEAPPRARWLVRGADAACNVMSFRESSYLIRPRECSKELKSHAVHNNVLSNLECSALVCYIQHNRLGNRLGKSPCGSTVIDQPNAFFVKHC